MKIVKIPKERVGVLIARAARPRSTWSRRPV